MESPNHSSFVAEDQWIWRSDLIAATEGFFDDRQKIAAARKPRGTSTKGLETANQKEMRQPVCSLMLGIFA
jgi:hypothetical protein